MRATDTTDTLLQGVGEGELLLRRFVGGGLVLFVSRLTAAYCRFACTASSRLSIYGQKEH
ncbi:hypothetical protein B6S59_20845 [Pseudomonas sp. A46]|nr:hypothetical protein B6S59_20845 [Pseudomonas sp. A46]